ncbi:MAG: HAD-IA family hydrolase [Planctomycetota bacterium]
MAIQQDQIKSTRRAAVIFDLDGTITKPYLDFDAIRAEIGIAKGPILEALSEMTGGAKKRAECIMLRHEQEAADNASLHDGAAEVVKTIRERGHPVGIVTRNSDQMVHQVLSKFGIVVDTVRSREFGAIKPSPEPVLSICAEFAAEPTQSWMIGDYLFDILSGKRAGTKTVLMVGDGDRPAYAEQAGFVITRLEEMLQLLTTG